MEQSIKPQSKEITSPIVLRKVNYSFHTATQSVCPVCNRLINAQRIIKNDRVYMRKFCLEHGHFEALISSSVDWFLRTYGKTRPDYRPRNFSTTVKNGCPYDCGLCPDHQHHTCKAVIEVTDDCDLKCPVCLVGKKGNYFLDLKTIEEMLDKFILCEGESAELVTISGGEPTMHPEILKILKMTEERNISCVHLNTNGIRLMRDEGFTEKLSQFKNLYINLQFDGFKPVTWLKTRGADLSQIKIKVLNLLEKYEIKTILTTTVIKDTNDDELGDILALSLEKNNIKAFNMQPIAYIGHASNLDYDADKHITMSDVIMKLEEKSHGLIKMNDWIAPCSPLCVANCYISVNRNDKRVSSIKDLLGDDSYRNVAHNRSDVSHELNNILDEKEQRSEEYVMKLNIHAFMDAYTFDIERVIQCCIHCLVPDGKILPWCAYNHFYRSSDNRYRKKFQIDPYGLSPNMIGGD